jgi:methylmalonyl-CoA/ethylmalonyl-CoA epimerase
MEKKFKKFMQVGLVVDDVDAFVQRYEQDFGIGPWDVIDFGPDTIPGLLVDGKPSTLRMRIAFYRSFEVELELIQPISESIYMDWLRTHGPGLHHVAFAPAEGYDALMEEYAKTGKKPLLEALDADKTRGFAYLDYLKELGLIVEVHKGQPG